MATEHEYKHTRKWPKAMKVHVGKEKVLKWTLSVTYYYSSHSRHGKRVAADLGKYKDKMGGGLWESEEAANHEREDFRNVVETWRMSEKAIAAFYKSCRASEPPPTSRMQR